VAQVYDAASLDETGTFSYAGQGWGLCSDGERLIMSDGSNQLQFRDRETFELMGTLEVTEDAQPLSGSPNELECLDGTVLANVWRTNDLVHIDLATGEVLARVDAYGLLSIEEELASGEMNGIAHDEASHRFYLTGKLWPKLFEVSIPLSPEYSGGTEGGGSLSASGVGSSGGPCASTLLMLALGWLWRRERERSG
jgi:glutamine cyclotransferase